jgi:hypothetical protein
VSALRLFVLAIVFPLLAIAMLWRRPRRPLGGWITTLLVAVAVTAFSVLTAPWGFFGVPMRIVLVVLLVAAAAVSIRRAPHEEPKDESPLRVVVKLLIAFLFGSVAAGVLRAHVVPPRAMDLTFPLRGGTYLVLHGGSTAAANIHHADAMQRYAVDFVKLNAAGMRARGLFPPDPRRYEIYDQAVFAPCAGTVVVADARRIVIRCGDVNVTLSEVSAVAVQRGKPVARGQLIARVGGSAEQGEPHLHVHAERKGLAVPMRFNGRWLVRNAIVRV